MKNVNIKLGAWEVSAILGSLEQGIKSGALHQGSTEALIKKIEEATKPFSCSIDKYLFIECGVNRWTVWEKAYDGDYEVQIGGFFSKSRDPIELKNRWESLEV